MTQNIPLPYPKHPKEKCASVVVKEPNSSASGMRTENRKIVNGKQNGFAKADVIVMVALIVLWIIVNVRAVIGVATKTVVGRWKAERFV
ncbi:MAG: hypothetical protein DRR19_27485 [Candidatus Parabeggiatoa sp. nov. 1]|nr:MAG: hypothetical protein DRR19_27485 [Gammaproteobacteria bacterium]